MPLSSSGLKNSIYNALVSALDLDDENISEQASVSINRLSNAIATSVVSHIRENATVSFATGTISSTGAADPVTHVVTTLGGGTGGRVS